MQGHDGERLQVGSWVAVAYDEGYYIGSITSLKSEDEIAVNFLMKSREGTYKWPKRKETDVVSQKYIFCSFPQVQRVSTDAFVLNNEENIEKSS